MVANAAAAPTLSDRNSAHERLTRGAARFVGAGGLFYGVVLLPNILAQTDLNAAWWTPFAVVAVFAPALGLIVAASIGTMTTIRQTVNVIAATYLVAQITWLLTWNGMQVGPEGGAWLGMFPGVASLATAIVWRPVPIFAYLFVVSALGQLLHYIARSGHGNNPLPLEISFGFTFCTLFTAACFAIVRAGRTLDDTAMTAELQASVTAAAEARAAERRRFDALIHDGVMATFLSASRSPNGAALTNQAAATLAQLDRLRSGSSSNDPFQADTLVAHLRASAAEVDDDVGLDVERGSGSGHLVVPSSVARALGAGLVEALRNVNRHARATACEVHVVLGERSIRVDVIDDGIGFDPASVPAHRLGLQVSIRGRFNQLTGAWSTVDSIIGEGTRVSMGWSGA